MAILSPTLPEDTKAYGNTTYLSPDGLLWFGTVALEFTSVYSKEAVDELISGIGGNLQSVTNGAGNNKTSNALYVTGADNYDTGQDGYLVLYAGDATQMINIASGSVTGGITMAADAISITQAGTGITIISDETSVNAKVSIEGRIGINPAINDNEAATLGQVTALIPTATNYIANGTSLQASSNFNISGIGKMSILNLSTLPVDRSEATASVLVRNLTSGAIEKIPGSAADVVRADGTVLNFESGVRSTLLTGLATNIAGEPLPTDSLLDGLSKFRNFFINIGTYVRGSSLVGLPAGTNTPITASNTVLNGMANLQAQISAIPIGNLTSVTTGTGNNITPNSIHISGENNFQTTDGLTLNATVQSNQSTSFIMNNKGATETEVSYISMYNQTGVLAGQMTFNIGGTDGSKQTLRLYQPDYAGNNGLVADFNGKVKGEDATEDDQFITQARLNSAISGIDLSNLVPYTGATGNVNLGSNSLTATAATFIRTSGTTPSDAITLINTGTSGSNVSPRLVLNGNLVTSNSGFGIFYAPQSGNTGILRFQSYNGTTYTNKFGFASSGIFEQGNNSSSIVARISPENLTATRLIKWQDKDYTVAGLDDLDGYAKLDGDNFFINGGVQTYYNNATGSNAFINTGVSGAVGVQSGTDTKFSTIGFDGILFNTHGLPSNGYANLKSDLITGAVVRTFQFPDASGTVALTSDLSNYVDLTTNQSGINGNKNFNGITTVSGRFEVYATDTRTEDLRVESPTGNTYFQLGSWAAGGNSPQEADIPNFSNSLLFYGRTLGDGRTHLSWKVRNVANTDVALYGGSLVQPQLTADQLWTLPNASGTIALVSDLPTFSSGTYTPTFTNVSNVTSLSPGVCHYIRIGNQVTVTGYFGGWSATGTSQSFNLSLPIASDLTTFSDLGGTGSMENTSGDINVRLSISAETVSNTAAINLISAASGGGGGNFTFMYTIQ